MPEPMPTIDHDFVSEDDCILCGHRAAKENAATTRNATTPNIRISPSTADAHYSITNQLRPKKKIVVHQQLIAVGSSPRDWCANRAALRSDWPLTCPPRGRGARLRALARRRSGPKWPILGGACERRIT